MQDTIKVTHRSRGEGKNLAVTTDLITYRGSREDGLASLFIELVSPPGGGPPPHTDPSEELFYILEGQFEFLRAGESGLESFQVGAGDSVVVPKRAVHTYKNVGTGNGRMLVVFPENENMQGFFEELGDTVSDESTWQPVMGQPDLTRIMAACRHYGVEFAGAPPANH